MIKTDVEEFIDELGAGALKEKIALALSEVALATVLHGSAGIKGKIALNFTFTKMGDHDQLIVTHKITSDRPTRRGRVSEHDTTETAMFVGKGGVMTIAPPREDQHGQFHLEEVTDGK